MLLQYLKPLAVGLIFCISAPVALAQDAAYRVLPGDVLTISVWKEPDLQGEVLVRPDGGFSFPLIGEVDARGKSLADLHKIVNERVARFIPEAVVTVSLKEINGNKVYVIGQVAKPGEFVITQRTDVMQALSMAGGTTPFAALGDIIVLRRSASGQRVLPFRYTDIVRGKSLEQNIQLESGDVVVVP